MKLSLVTLALVASVSFADVKVVSAIYNESTGMIEAQLQYGGCKKPAFKLKFDRGCYETAIPQADAKVLQIAGDDGCERLNHSTQSFTLAGNPCVPYGRHFVNLYGSNGSANGSANGSERIQVEITRN